jgi:hypothetical protein
VVEETQRTRCALVGDDDVIERARGVECHEADCVDRERREGGTISRAREQPTGADQAKGEADRVGRCMEGVSDGSVRHGALRRSRRVRRGDAIDHADRGMTVR